MSFSFVLGGLRWGVMRVVPMYPLLLIPLVSSTNFAGPVRRPGRMSLARCVLWCGACPSVARGGFAQGQRGHGVPSRTVTRPGSAWAGSGMNSPRIVVVIGSLILRAMGAPAGEDVTEPDDYEADASDPKTDPLPPEPERAPLPT